MSFVKLPVLRHGLMIRHEEIFLDAVMAERIKRIRKLMEDQGVGGLIAYSNAIQNGPVCYLTNYPCFGLGRRGAVALGLEEGPFLFTAEPARNLPRVRLFTTCDLEKGRQFLSAACDRVKNLSKNSPVGLVGFENLPLALAKDSEKELEGLKKKDLSRDFSAVLAAKDEGSLKATKRARELAEEGIRLLKDQVASGKDLWQLAAQVDYRLRLLGCEDTNILLGCADKGRVRPGYPARIKPRSGDTVVAYAAVQYARHWGVAGYTFSVGSANKDLDASLARLGEVQKSLAPKVKTGMTLGEIEVVIAEAGRQAGLMFAPDLPLGTGVGFDLSEYPSSAEDEVRTGMVLQVVLASDVDQSFTAMIVDMLQVTHKGGVWLGRSGN
ncbi:MAG: M24 family metallopeptidase [Thermodesulfobacteriota bacterium]